jgi:hypothetical protein
MIIKILVAMLIPKLQLLEEEGKFLGINSRIVQ